MTGRSSVVPTGAVAQQTRHPAPLRWARPDTTGWTVIDLDDHVTNPPGQTIFLPQGGGNYVVHQTIPRTIRTDFHTKGPANIAWIGGEVFVDTEQFADGEPHNAGAGIAPMEGCHFEGDFRLIYLEGVLMHGSHLIEGIDIFEGFQAMPVIQNCRIITDPVVLYEDVNQDDGYTHTDCIEAWGGISYMRIANSTMITNANGGLFGAGALAFQPVAAVWANTELHRVNYASGKNTPSYLTTAWKIINFVQIDRVVGPFIFDEVYLDQRERQWAKGTPGLGLYQNVAFWEGTDSVDGGTGRHLWKFGQTYPSAGIWTSTDLEAEGYVIRGRPRGGDFCPEHVAGLNYRPPPQIVSEPFCIGGGSEENHLANRPVARTAMDYLNGSTFVSRQWTVLSGPTGVGALTTAAAFQTNTFNEVGTYFIQYELATDSGTASSKMRLDVIEANPNWLLNGKDFSLGLSEWYIGVDTGTATFDAVGDEARFTVTSSGSLVASDRYSDSNNATLVFPGEQFTASVAARQVTGSGSYGRMAVQWVSSARGLLAYEDSGDYITFPLGSSETVVSHTFTVPVDAGYAILVFSVLDAETGDDIRFKTPYLGDVV